MDEDVISIIFISLFSIVFLIFFINTLEKQVLIGQDVYSHRSAMNFALIVNNELMGDGALKQEMIENYTHISDLGVKIVDYDRGINWTFGASGSKTLSIPTLIENDSKTYAAKIMVYYD